jgi:hypothetical protein
MRFKETTGRWPLMKAKQQKPKAEVVSASQSPASSGIFEKENIGEKAVETVHAVPARRTISE